MNSSLFGDRLKRLEEAGLKREIKPFTTDRPGHIKLNGKSYALFCSNDYLGLSRHPDVIAAQQEGAARYGAGAGAARLVSGAMEPHAELERALAEFTGLSACLLFNTGFAANSGIIPALAGKGDVILADKLNHASLVDGCRLSRATFKRYPHADMAALEKLLQKNTTQSGETWIITDGMFSMDGDLAPLPEICGLAEKYGARVYLDDAHAFGILGEHGRGSAEFFGVQDKVDVYVGTLGKAAGVAGAFAGGSRELIEYLTSTARSFIYSTAMPPAVAHSGVKAVEILGSYRSERKEFLRRTENFNRRLAKSGFAQLAERYIIPLLTGDPAKALKAERLLLGEGIYVQAIRPPTVPEGTARLRLTLSLAQTEEEQMKATECLLRNKDLFTNTRGDNDN